MDVRVDLPVTERVKLSVRNLNFYYGGFHALKNINMDIPEKKVTAFIGPSGCGKSTQHFTITQNTHKLRCITDPCSHPVRPSSGRRRPTSEFSLA